MGYIFPLRIVFLYFTFYYNLIRLQFTLVVGIIPY